MINNPRQRTIIFLGGNVMISILEIMISVFCANHLGATGMGVFSIIVAINAMFVALIKEGVVATISKLTSEYKAAGNHYIINQNVRIFGLFNLTLGCILSGIVFFAAPTLSMHFFGGYGMSFSIMMLCLSLPVMAVANVLKGYCLGTSNILYPIAVDILEKFTRFFLLCLVFFIGGNQPFNVRITMVFFCYAILEGQSLLLLYLYYKRIKQKVMPGKYTKKSPPIVLRNILRLSMPLWGIGVIFELLNLLIAIIIPAKLIQSGLGYTQALTLFGEFKGMALVIINFPLVVIAALNTLLIPRLSNYRIANQARVNQYIKKLLFISLSFSLCAAMFLYCFANPIVQILYHNSNLVPLVKHCSFMIPFVAFNATLSNILIVLNQQNKVFKHTLVEYTLFVIGTYLLVSIPQIQINGYIISKIFSHIVLFLLNIRILWKVQANRRSIR